METTQTRFGDTGWWTGAAAAENAALFHKRVVEAQGFSQFWVRMKVELMAEWLNTGWRCG